jgi:hypothetical protein
MKHSKARAKLRSYVRCGGVTNIRDVIQIISQILQLFIVGVVVTIFRKYVFYILMLFPEHGYELNPGIRVHSELSERAVYRHFLAF